MTTHPIDTFGSSEDLAAVRKLHADAAETTVLRETLGSCAAEIVRLNAEVQRLRAGLDDLLTFACGHRAAGSAIGERFADMIEDILEVPRG